MFGYLNLEYKIYFMKYLGIDYGSKRIGIAVSDDQGVFAFPKVIIENKKNKGEKIKEICENENIENVVMGESIDSNGFANPIMKKITIFKKYLEDRLSLVVYLEPEFMTSHHVAIGGKKGEFKKDRLDSSAAALILQRFLDKRNDSK